MALALFPSFSNLLCTAYAFRYVRPPHHTLSTLRLSLVLDLSLSAAPRLTSASLRIYLNIFASLMHHLASVVGEVAHHDEDATDEENSAVNGSGNDNRDSEA
jgi:hypothetical protein